MSVAHQVSISQLVTAEGGQTRCEETVLDLATVCDYLGGCVSPEHFLLPLRSIRARFASRRAAQERRETAASGSALPGAPQTDRALWRNRKPRGTTLHTLARGHVCRFRNRPEYSRQTAARNA